MNWGTFLGSEEPVPEGRVMFNPIQEKYLNQEWGKDKRHTRCPTGNSAEASFVQLNKLTDREKCIENKIFTSVDACNLFLVTKSRTEGQELQKDLIKLSES